MARGPRRRHGRKHDGRRVTGDVIIEALDDAGRGEGRLAGRPIRIPMTLPGDRAVVEAGPGPGGFVGEVREWLERRPRATPTCRHFGTCGGCQLQHLDPDGYGAWIVSRIERALGRQGIIDVEIRPPRITPPGSRRRIRLGFGRAGGRLRLGHREVGSHRIVDLEMCPIARPAIVALVEPLREVLAVSALDTGEALITEASTGLDLLLIADTIPDLEVRERLAAFAAAHDLTRLAFGQPHVAVEPLVMRRPVVAHFDTVAVRLPVGAFLQASREAETMIRGAVTEALGRCDRVADLYAGCGTFALPLAASGRKILAVEGNPAMADALAAAARDAGLSDRLTVQSRDLERRPLQRAELTGLQGAVLDPPRAGARAQVLALLGAPLKRIAMVSCNPSTLGRDLRALIDAGFRLDWVQPIDPFLWSAEVEAVAALRGPAP